MVGNFSGSLCAVTQSGKWGIIDSKEIILLNSNFLVARHAEFQKYCVYFKGKQIAIQIENAFQYGIKLVVKILDWQPNTLYTLLNDIKPIGEK